MATTYTLDQTPTLAEVMDSGDVVTVAIYNKATGAVVPLDANATTEIGVTGIYRYTVDMTTEPEDGKNEYIYIFTGTLQKRYGEFNWVDVVAAFNEKVHIDTVGGTSGSEYPQGKIDSPVDNWADAKIIAAKYGFTKFHLMSALTLDSIAAGYTFISDSPTIGSIATGGQDITNSSFEKVTMSGAGNGHFLATECIILNMTDLDCDLNGCNLAGSAYSVEPLKIMQGKDCSFSNVTGATVDNQATGSVAFGNSDGVVIFTNKSGALTFIAFTGRYIITLAASITGGIILLAGIGSVTDGSSGTTLTDNTVPGEILELLDNQLIVDDTLNTLNLYNAAGDTIIKTWPLKDKDGNDIALTGTGPAQRILRTL